MYQALYRKYRPQTLDDVVGQKTVIKTLKNSIINNKISHAYLFSGPRGTGKTSIAKIFAKIINCYELNETTACNKCASCEQINLKQSVDIVEIDAASNNGVDEIRELRDKVGLVPLYGKYKIYIIDEVHMLTTAAFNALLKTLEEPPSHAIFILATTEPHKLPTTIISRCQRFEFKKISVDDIKNRLTFICKEEKIKIEPDALDIISRISDGGLRDSIGLLDQLSSYTSLKITINDVNDICGILTIEEIYEFFLEIFNNKADKVLELIEKYDSSGKNLMKIIEMMIDYLKNCLIFSNTSYITNLNLKKQFENILNIVNEKNIYEIINIFIDTIKNSKSSSNIKLIFELSIIRILNIISDSKKINTSDPFQNVQIDKTKNVTNYFNEDNHKKENISKVKKIRINNTLALFNKKELIEFKNKITSANFYNKENNSLSSLILDGELKAKGKNYLIFVYKKNNLAELFNFSLDKIEQLLYESFNDKYMPIAVNLNEWEIIKNEFNLSLKQNNNKYKYIPEEEIKKENSNIEQMFDDKKIDDLFSDIIEYN